MIKLHKKGDAIGYSKSSDQAEFSFDGFEEYDISDLSEKELAKIQKDPSKGKKYATKKRKRDKI